MEDIRIVFSNIMEKLLKQAHKNKNVLEYKEINDAFKNIELTPEKPLPSWYCLQGNLCKRTAH